VVQVLCPLLVVEWEEEWLDECDEDLEVECDEDLEEDLDEDFEDDLEEVKVAVPELWGTGGTV